MGDSYKMPFGRTSSKGNQNKWYSGGYWYKEDSPGYEALSETLISRLLEKTNVGDFVKYGHIRFCREGGCFNACRSADFMRDDDDRLVSVERLFQLQRGESAASICAGIPDVAGRIQYIVENVEKMTGLEDFGKILRMTVTLDALFLNEDRHFHNIAVIRRKDGTFREAPIFDNGAALFSDTLSDYPLSLDIEKCYAKIEAKPFSADFDRQLDEIEMLYGPRFKAWFTIGDVLDILHEFEEYYDKAVLDRVEEVLRRQMRKYRYLFL